MLTPQEVADKKFKQVFVGGYDMTSVDSFLEQLTEDFTALFKENAVLKNKMKVLVEKLEEYRSNEDSIRRAYLAIHAQAEQELNDARDERDRLMRELRTEADERAASITEMISQEEKRLSLAKQQTASFVGTLQECYAKQIEQLNVLLTVSIEDSPKKKREAARTVAAQEIDSSLSAQLNDIPEPQPFQSPQAELEPEPEREAVDAGEAGAEEIMEQAADDVTKRIGDEIFSVEHSFTSVFGDDNDDIWTPEEVTESRPPQFDFSSLEKNFGHIKQEKSKKKHNS